jgi:hypothetical protein
LYSKFFEICKQRGLFGDIVSLLKQIVGSDIDIITRQDLMNKLMELDFKDSENSKLFFRLLLWKETVNALDPRTRNVFLHNVKLDCERGLMGELKNIRGYEKLRFDALQTPETKVVFECRCSSCPNYTPAALNVLDYKERMIYADIKPSKLSDKTYFDYLVGISELCLGTLVLKVKCPACQTHNSLRIPFMS